MHEQEDSFLDNFFSSLTNLKAILTIIGIGLVVFSNSLLNMFVWDDIIQIVNNGSIDSLQKIPELFTVGQLGVFYRPVFFSTLAILFNFFGDQVFFYHIVQLGIHIINVCLVYLLFKKFIDEKLSLLLSIIFLIHPLNVESVVYISAISDPLFVLFGLLAFHFMDREKENIGTALMASLFLLLSVLTKEAGFLLLIIIVLYRFFFKRKNIQFILLFIILPIIVYALLRFVVADIYYAGVDVVPIAQASNFERLITAPKILYYYLSNLVFPSSLAIAQEWVVRSITLTAFVIPLAVDMLFLGVLIYFGKALHKESRKIFSLYLFFVLWFLIGISLYFHIIPLDMTVADRWFYLPFIGLLGSFGILISHIPYLQKHRNTIVTILIISIVILSFRTLVRNTNWFDGYSLYSHDAQASENYHLENNLAAELLKRGQIDSALLHADRSVKLNPEWGTSWTTVGVIYMTKKDYVKANTYFKKGLEKDGGNYPAFYFLSQSYLFTKNYTDAKGLLDHGLKSFPNNGPLIQLLAVAEYNLGNQEKALELAQKAIDLNAGPQSQTIYNTILNKQPLQLQ